MRKLINKKGFSLVELMIVVVIMGILIAVAIPLYGAITANAEKRTCMSNQKLIQEMFAKYCLTDDGKTSADLLPTGEYNSKTNADGTLDPQFLTFFEQNELPRCSIKDHYFVIKPIQGQSHAIEIKCYDAEGNYDATHTIS